uniref:POU domain protein n=1 Tax=Macrostomum lignano TaxID=282301 RepID=A0A1I8IWR0_9PLAT
ELLSPVPRPAGATQRSSLFTPAGQQEGPGLASPASSPTQKPADGFLHRAQQQQQHTVKEPKDKGGTLRVVAPWGWEKLLKPFCAAPCSMQLSTSGGKRDPPLCPAAANSRVASGTYSCWMDEGSRPSEGISGQQQQQVHQSSPMHGGGSSPSGIQWLEEARAISQTLSQETIRDLEQFAEAFKQRRVKLGFTQADVGRDIAQLNVAGMGSLSQSTICRFESLTLSHNNMLALRPILEQWLVHAERQYQSRLCSGLREAKRRRTSIATPERRSLEAYFAVQSRPSSDKIGDIAQKLGLKKSVVRVWFCNQRQKQKRIKIGNCQADQAPPTPTCRRLPLPPGEAEDFEVGTDEDSGQTLDIGQRQAHPNALASCQMNGKQQFT